MKKLFFFLLSIGITLITFASNHPAKNLKLRKTFDCTSTVTSNSTVSGTDCDGNAFSVTASSTCTQTASDCTSASAGATACSQLGARNKAIQYASMLVKDCN